jgi:hypothetical protein
VCECDVKFVLSYSTTTVTGKNPFAVQLHNNNNNNNNVDRVCGLAVRVPGYRSRGPGSIPGATRFSEK